MDKKILIIEDDVAIADLYKKELEKAGYKVVIANSGGEGLTLASEEKPAVILLDIMMPAIDGFTVIRNLKEKKETAETPIIILTNLGTSKIFIEEARRLGVENYLLKYKASLKDVINTIEKVLKKE